MDTEKMVNIGEIWPGWETKEYIGEGAFGKVYKIVREEFDHTYESALKVITIPASKGELKTYLNSGFDEKSATLFFRGMVEDIVKEFVLMSRLRGNSNIVSYEDHTVIPHQDGVGWDIYLRMELLTPLYDYMKKHPFTVQDVIKLGIDICQALEVCQKYHIIHRDIKPENIFVSDLGSYKLGDFGIARKLEKTSSGLSKKGTYSFMAPEVYKGEDYNVSVDIYSLGIVLYRFLNNNRNPFLPPFPEPIHYTDPEKANEMRFRGDVFPVPCNADGKLAEIVLKACAYAPRERYQSPEKMKEALQEALELEQEIRFVSPEGEITGETDRVWGSGTEDTANNPGSIDFLSLDDISGDEGDSGKGEKTWGLFGQQKPISPSEEELQQPEREAALEEKGAAAEAKEPAGQNSAAESGTRKNLRIILTAAGAFAVVILTAVFMIQGNQKAEVKKNSIVSVEVSLGKGLKKVPKVTDLTKEEAGKILEETGLSWKFGEEVYSDTVEAGIVVSQSPEAGKILGKETGIVLIVSKGKELVQAPNVVGQTEKDAKKSLKAAGLKVKVKEEEDYNETVEVGIVVSQSVNGGENAAPGTKVEIVISKGPKPVEETAPEPIPTPKPKPSSPPSYESPEPEPQEQPAAPQEPQPTVDPDEEDTSQWDLIN